MKQLDLVKFWEDDAPAHKDNCFSETAPQVALGIRMSEECVFAELNEKGHPWDESSMTRERRIDLNKRYNDKAEKIVGKRFLREDFPPEDAALPELKRIGEIFGGRYIIHNYTEWLESDIKTPKQLEAQLDFIDKTDLREYIFPANWQKEKEIKFERYGTKPHPYRWVRGPITLACSIIGVEKLIFLILDEPDLAKRFSDTMADVIIKLGEIMEEESGEKSGGFGFADDNCCMLNLEMYEFFGYPILKRVFERFAPDASHMRYQHSDSAMEHLLPVLGTLNFTGVNFGPTVTIDKIRKYMPKTRIDGCIAPFTFMNNETEKLIEEVKRDCDMARQYGRGLNLSTAGSINNGSSLESLRTIMWAITEYGRY